MDNLNIRRKIIKTTKRILPVLLTLLIGATALGACGDNNDASSTGGETNTPNATTISAAVLDGKIANLMSANGMRYVEYGEQNPTKEWSEYSATPVQSTLKLEAYYQFLTA